MSLQFVELGICSAEEILRFGQQEKGRLRNCVGTVLIDGQQNQLALMQTENLCSEEES
jgi:hypothetical protein